MPLFVVFLQTIIVELNSFQKWIINIVLLITSSSIGFKVRDTS